MTETLKVNLDRTYLFLRITAIVAGALISFAVIYGKLDERMDSYEIAQAVDAAKNANRDKQIDKVGEKLDKIYEYIVQTKSGKHLIAEGR